MLLENFLERSARRYADKPAVVCGDETIAYGELERRANRLAHALRALGVERGDRVAIHLDNSIEAVTAIFAALKAGAVFLMVNPTTKPDKLRFVLEDCRARALIARRRRLLATEHLATMIAMDPPARADKRPVAPDTERGAREACDNGAKPAAPTLADWHDLLADDAYPTSPPPKAHIDIDLAALVYTSGSTGRPKGVMLTHRNMVAAATSITTYLENVPEDVILSVLPLSFDYGLYQALMSVKIGGTLLLERSFAYPHAVMLDAEAQRATGLPLVPTMLAMLLQMDLERYDLSRLRYVTNTGAALPVEHIRQLRRRLPHVDIYSMYGLTECKRVAYLPPEEVDTRPNSVGKAMPNCEAYLIDDEGRRLPLGSTGELVVRGGNVMPGYWERPEETAAALRDGPLPGERILATGDVFRTDSEGYLYFVGRKDDIIKSRGEKVSPREVEDVLTAHPAVAEAAVIGVANALLGQAVHAFVAPREGHEPSERELLRHCAGQLEDFMVPRHVAICDHLPRTANGKIDKKALAQSEAGTH